MDILSYKLANEYTDKKIEEIGGDKSKLVSELENNNILYYRLGAIENPIEGDRRDTGKGIGRNGDEVFVNGSWNKKIDVGSIGTDMITLRDGLNDIKVKLDNKYFNLIRNLKTLDGIQVGSSFKPLALTSSGRYELKHYYPDKNETFKYIHQDKFDKISKLPGYCLVVWNNADAIVKSLNLKAQEDTRVRLRMYVTTAKTLEQAILEKSDKTLVYESIPESIYKNPENPMYGGTLIPKGDFEAELSNEMYLTNNAKYLLEFEGLVEGNLLGNGLIPYFEVNYYKEKNEIVVTNETIEERLTRDIMLDEGMWLASKLGKTPEGENPKKANIGGMYGEDMCISDTNVKTILKSKGTPRMMTNENDLVSNIASEDFVKFEAIPKVFHKDELESGRTGLIIQTIPMTYTMFYPEEFKTYNSLGFIKVLSCKFMPNLHNSRQVICRDGRNETSVDIRSGQGALINFVCYKKDGGFESISIDTSMIENPPSGHSYPSVPYICSDDRREEENKVWKYDYASSGEISYITMIDPNDGQWTVHLENTTHCAEGGIYHFGTDENNEPVKRFWDLFFDAHDKPIEPTDSDVVDEHVTGIQTARLVTKMRRDAIDILDPIAVHKYADLTKNFHDFFEPKSSGLYRCFGMTENLPNGYIVGDNDFYVNVYTTSMNYKCLEALDIRSGRKFIKNMYNGNWNEWVETGGVASVPLVPKSIYQIPNAVKGTATQLSLVDLKITKNDVISVSCGTRGMAVQVNDVNNLSNYASAYFMDFDNNKLIYRVDSEGTSRCSIEIFKYVPKEVEPPKPWHPYLNLKDVQDDLSNGTKTGDKFYLEIAPVSWELVRNPQVIITLPKCEERVELQFDGKERYYFNFPFDCTDRFVSGEKVGYHLLWSDQLDVYYEGTELIIKQILV